MNSVDSSKDIIEYVAVEGIEKFYIDRYGYLVNYIEKSENTQTVKELIVNSKTELPLNTVLEKAKKCLQKIIDANYGNDSSTHLLLSTLKVVCCYTNID